MPYTGPYPRTLQDLTQAGPYGMAAQLRAPYLLQPQPSMALPPPTPPPMPMVQRPQAVDLERPPLAAPTGPLPSVQPTEAEVQAKQAHKRGLAAALGNLLGAAFGGPMYRGDPQAYERTRRQYLENVTHAARETERKRQQQLQEQEAARKAQSQELADEYRRGQLRQQEITAAADLQRMGKEQVTIEEQAARRDPVSPVSMQAKATLEASPYAAPIVASLKERGVWDSMSFQDLDNAAAIEEAMQAERQVDVAERTLEGKMRIAAAQGVGARGLAQMQGRAATVTPGGTAAVLEGELSNTPLDALINQLRRQFPYSDKNLPPDVKSDLDKLRLAHNTKNLKMFDTLVRTIEHAASRERQEIKDALDKYNKTQSDQQMLGAWPAYVNLVRYTGRLIREKRGEVDLPGTGLEKTLTHIIPSQTLREMAVGPEGRRFNQYKHDLIDVIARIRTGARITEDEQEMYLSLLGAGPGQTDQDFVAGLERMGKWFKGIDDSLRSTAGFDKRIWEGMRAENPDLPNWSTPFESLLGLKLSGPPGARRGVIEPAAQPSARGTIRLTKPEMQGGYAEVDANQYDPNAPQWAGWTVMQ